MVRVDAVVCRRVLGRVVCKVEERGHPDAEARELQGAGAEQGVQVGPVGEGERLL